MAGSCDRSSVVCFFCEGYAVHARTAITFGDVNTVIWGDLSIYPSSAITYTANFKIIDGELSNRDNSSAFDATLDDSLSDAIAYRDDTQTFDKSMDGMTFTPGTWHSTTGIEISAEKTVTLDAEGDPDAEFLFATNSSILLGENVKINLINGARWQNVLWATGPTGMFTAGANVDFNGSILSGEKLVFGSGLTMHGCAVSLTAVTFGANNLISVLNNAIEARSKSPSESPSSTPSQSPTPSPTVSLTVASACIGYSCDADFSWSPKTTADFSADFTSSPPTSAVEILEKECPEDVQLVAINGVTEYGDVPPIHILSQDQDTVTFQVHQNMIPGSVSYMYTHYHTAPHGDPKCSTNAIVTQFDTLIFTAGCMHLTHLSLVDLWVADAALDADNDTAKPFHWCPDKDTVLPAVQYTFKLHCVSQCVPTSAPTEAIVIDSRARNLHRKDMVS
jgi:hypothetical protein